MKTKLIKVKGDWQEVMNDCRFTVGKEPLDKEPSEAFKRSIVIAEHSPIRSLVFKWRWEDMPHWVVVHWVRHKWEKFVRTQRSDRTGIPRDELPQNTPQSMIGEANTQHLIDTMRKRLCYLASSETRRAAVSLKREIDTAGYEEVSFALVPNCVYRGGCPEMNGCGWYDNVKIFYPQIASNNIAERYECYNKLMKE